jgi:hypothetical protein
VGTGQTEEAAMYGREVAMYRIDDMVRDADRYRLSRTSRASRAAERRGRLRRIAATAISIIAWPLRH